MKNATYKLAITVFAAAVLAVPLAAQTVTLRADIPFEFTVGSTTLPAGHYDIRTTSGGAAVLLQSGEAHGYFLATPQSAWTAQPPVLAFRRYGDRYFLSAVMTAFATRQAPASKQENELGKSSVSAVRRSQNETLVALR